MEIYETYKYKSSTVMAIQQKQEDQQAREMAMSNMSSKMGGI